jgi:hypothetical protein
MGTPRVPPERLAPHLAELEYLEFIKMPSSTAEEAAKWSEQLPPDYSVFHCPSHER